MTRFTSPSALRPTRQDRHSRRGQPGRHLRRGDAPRHRRRHHARLHRQEGGGHRRRQRGHGRDPQRHPPGRGEGKLRLPPPPGRHGLPWPKEVEGALAEGGGAPHPSRRPVRIEADENGHATALWVQPQIIGPVGRDGRPRPNKAGLPRGAHPRRPHSGGHRARAWRRTTLKRAASQCAGAASWPRRTVASTTQEGVFAGGDCVTGPATAIRAIAAGKVAAANIDEYLGFQPRHHHRRADSPAAPAQQPAAPMAA